MRIFLKVFLLFFFSTSLLKADNDSSRVSTQNPNSLTKFFNKNQWEFDSTFCINSSLHDFQKYIPKNTLGNTGLAVNELYYNPFTIEPGFNYFKNNFSNYFFSPQNIQFYNTRTPYTDLFYVIGTKKEQFFKMTFSYNIKKNWNVTTDFMRIRSEGTYLRQNTNDNSIAISTNYKSENNKYWVLGGIIFNSYKNAENGGIADDSVFKKGGSVDQRLLDISLTDSKHNFGNANVFIKQIYNLGSKSSDTTKQEIIPSSRFILNSSLDATYLKYEDNNPTSGYYSNIFYDSTRTADSTFFYKVDNELSWKRLNNHKYRGVMDILGFGLSLKHEFIKVQQKSTDSVFNNIMGGAEIYNTYSQHSLFWNVSGKYVLTGYNKEDYDLKGIIKKENKDSLISITVKTESRLQAPDFIYNSYKSNNFYWSNSFDKAKKIGAEVYFSLEKYDFEINAGINTYSNILYFDNYAMARQFKGKLTIISAAIKKDFNFYNWHLNNKVIYQNVPDSSVIRVPEFILEHSLYYENDLLKKALVLQVGASMFYTSSYYANAYMPSTAEFYLQTEKKYGAYPFIDFFINAQVKTVRIFFKIDHLNSGWTGSNYILTPNYPYPGRTFKFGVSWKFYD